MLVATAEQRNLATSAPTLMRCLHKATRVKQRRQRRRRRHKVTLPRWVGRRGRRMRDRSCTTRDGWAERLGERLREQNNSSVVLSGFKVMRLGPMKEGSFLDMTEFYMGKNQQWTHNEPRTFLHICVMPNHTTSAPN